MKCSCSYLILPVTLIAALLHGCGGVSISADELNLDKNIDLVATSTMQWTGVAVSSGSRLFVNYPNWSSAHTISVAEINGSQSVDAFPDKTWNTWSPELDPATHFICVQSVFIDNNDFLWVLDAANVQRNGLYEGVINGGAKLLKFNLQNRELVQSIVFQAPAIKASSYLNDVRIDEEKNIAYITNSNEGALLVVDLTTGEVRRVLETSAATKSENRVLTIEGLHYKNTQGAFPIIHADGIALNRERTYLYWRALTAEGLYRISTDVLNEKSVDEAALKSHVEKMGSFPPSDGMEFGFYGELYLSSIEENAVRAYNHGNATRLIRQREDIKWPDSFAVSKNGFLYFTSSQLHLLHPGEPYKLFRIQIRF